MSCDDILLGFPTPERGHNITRRGHWVQKAELALQTDLIAQVQAASCEQWGHHAHDKHAATDHQRRSQAKRNDTVDMLVLFDLSEAERRIASAAPNDRSMANSIRPGFRTPNHHNRLGIQHWQPARRIHSPRLDYEPHMLKLPHLHCGQHVRHAPSEGGHTMSSRHKWHCNHHTTQHARVPSPGSFETAPASESCCHAASCKFCSVFTIPLRKRSAP